MIVPSGLNYAYHVMEELFMSSRDERLDARDEFLQARLAAPPFDRTLHEYRYDLMRMNGREYVPMSKDGEYV